jgi:hypothetical protein
MDDPTEIFRGKGYIIHLTNLLYWRPSLDLACEEPVMTMCQYRACLIGGSSILWLTTVVGLFDSLPIDLIHLFVIAFLGLALVLVSW